jgi:hypothetical protein
VTVSHSYVAQQYDIEYDIGDVDQIEVQLLNTINGVQVPVKLVSGSVVVFNMTTTDGNTSKTLTCTLGGTDPATGLPLDPLLGWVTLNVTANATSTAALFNGVFLAVIGTNIYRIPSGNNSYQFKVWQPKA